MERNALTRAEAAETLGCSVWSIDHYIKTGVLRAIQVGAGPIRRHVRIPKLDIELLIKGGRGTSQGAGRADNE